MPCGFLVGSGGAADLIPDLMEKLEVPHKNMIIFDEDPEQLVQKVIAKLDELNHGIDTAALANKWFLSGEESQQTSNKG
jgi:hypothetical protein